MPSVGWLQFRPMAFGANSTPSLKSESCLPAFGFAKMICAQTVDQRKDLTSTLPWKPLESPLKLLGSPQASSWKRRVNKSQVGDVKDTCVYCSISLNVYKTRTVAYWKHIEHPVETEFLLSKPFTFSISVEKLCCSPKVCRPEQGLKATSSTRLHNAALTMLT